MSFILPPCANLRSLRGMVNGLSSSRDYAGNSSTACPQSCSTLTESDGLRQPRARVAKLPETGDELPTDGNPNRQVAESPEPGARHSSSETGNRLLRKRLA